MRIHRMQVSFGKLQGEVLELRDGLNILQAPNEAGKSTWCAFLLEMFYGIDTSERNRTGFIADKNRYAPWNGAPDGGIFHGSVSGKCLGRGCGRSALSERGGAGGPGGSRQDPGAGG